MLAISRVENKEMERLRRDTRGRFVKKKTIDLFTFPFEIRAMIYTDLFLYERPNRKDKIWCDPKSSLKLKSPLLQASKFVRAEALPLFYRHHIFYISVPKTCIDILKPRIHESITRVQIESSRKPFQLYYHRSKSEDRSSCAKLQHLLDHLPNLQIVRIGFDADTYALKRDRVTVRTDMLFRYLLEDLWPRLSYLELHILQFSLKVDSSDFREAVAPDVPWVLKTRGFAKGKRRSVSKYVWVAQRNGKPPR